MQLHPHKTPLARDVNFRTLAEKYAASGGDIKNAVIKAAAAAAAEPGSDISKAIHQRHFERAIEEVLAAKQVMQQTLFDGQSLPMLPPDPRVAWALVIAAGSLIAALTALAVALLR